MFTRFITTNWSHGHLQGLLISQQITFCFSPPNHLVKMLLRFDYILWRMAKWTLDKHYMFMLRWDDDQWPQCLPPSDTSHSPRSNGSVPSLRQPQAAARISQDWLTGNEHARLDNADILGEISSSGYWELLDFMQFIGVSIWCVLKTSLKRTQSPGRQCVFWWESEYYLRVWHSDK